MVLDPTQNKNKEFGLPPKEPRYVNINFKLSEAEKDLLVAYANKYQIQSLHIAGRIALMAYLDPKEAAVTLRSDIDSSTLAGQASFLEYAKQNVADTE